MKSCEPSAARRRPAPKNDDVSHGAQSAKKSLPYARTQLGKSIDMALAAGDAVANGWSARGESDFVAFGTVRVRLAALSFMPPSFRLPVLELRVILISRQDLSPIKTLFPTNVENA